MLNTNHLSVMNEVREGATIWGYIEAKLLREVQQFDENLIDILEITDVEKITGEVFDGAKQLPYFGAILTDKGKTLLQLANEQNIHSELFSNCKFEFYHDEVERTIHILDAMGQEPYKSVTNGINDIYPYILGKLELRTDQVDFIILYGTDNVITQYDYSSKNFGYIDSNSGLVFSKFQREMNVLYA